MTEPIISHDEVLEAMDYHVSLGRQASHVTALTRIVIYLMELLGAQSVDIKSDRIHKHQGMLVDVDDQGDVFTVVCRKATTLDELEARMPDPNET